MKFVEKRREDIGLCADCKNARVVRSDRGSEFYRCELASTDAGFPKYPRLPVWQCDGYEEGRAVPPSV